MKIQPLIEKLEGTKVYKKFKEEYKDSFLVAGFFVLDYETNKNINQIIFTSLIINSIRNTIHDGEH